MLRLQQQTSPMLRYRAPLSIAHAILLMRNAQRDQGRNAQGQANHIWGAFMDAGNQYIAAAAGNPKPLQ